MFGTKFCKGPLGQLSYADVSVQVKTTVEKDWKSPRDRLLMAS